MADEADARAKPTWATTRRGGLAGAIRELQDEFKTWLRDPAKTKKPAGTLPGGSACNNEEAARRPGQEGGR
ncbi:hypothetical protein [Delftia sp.]|uniref:hypothetical protein n=1 Tax=Delftia sp. TaxID=1886637 RepID=UPI00259D062B|nr:hypothetical protein [Delftia sp.]